MIISDEQEVVILREMKRLERLMFIDNENYGVFVKVCDKSLDKIRSDGNALKNIDFMKQILDEDGDNFHILFLKWNQGIASMIIYLKEFSKKFKTVSWSSHDLKKFVIKGERNVSCAYS